MTEKILMENPGRFVLFPIQHDDLWRLFKQQEACFWTAEEIDLGQDVYDWENKLNAIKFTARMIVSRNIFFLFQITILS